MFNFGRFTEKRPKPIIPRPTLELFLIPPEDIMKMRGASQLSFQIWYKAIYIVRENPGIKTNALAAQIGVSWATADKLREAIQNYLDAH